MREMESIARMEGNVLKFNKKAIKEISKKLVDSLAESLYHQMLLLKFIGEVEAIKAGKIKKVSSEELKEALN